MNKQRGVSMVEALVALVVLSIGMLGIAALYVETMRANRTALTRTQAVSLVNDMADRIRANPSGRNAYGGAGVLHNCIGVDCSPTDLAQDDLARWDATLQNTIPAAIGTVAFNVGPSTTRPDEYRIAVSWREPGETVDFSYQTSLQMIPVTP